jgi:NADH-quinone oxidoreductase subunit L
VQLWPIGGGLPSWLPAFLTKPRMVDAATMVGLMLMLGCAGKSAQIPLYVWLPDAMAGPTPVSALIHAATMVTAGVYLVARMNFVFMLSPTAMMVVASVGALTALFAATIGLVQNDIKKVLAYSTVSQLGFMFMGVGVGAFASGIFHLVTHAFFKAALFLCAGCVIHAMHARVHDTDASQDMRNMGGLRKYMPRTFFAYTAATLAIAGFPLTAGFFSKDEILFRGLVNRIEPTAALKQLVARSAPRGLNQDQLQSLVSSLTTPSWFHKAVFIIGIAAAVLTAFYMFRSWILTFFGDFRGWRIVPGWKDAGPEHDAHEQDGPLPLEAPASMTWPVVILAVLALVAGFINAGSIHLTPYFEHWLSPVFEGSAKMLSTVQTGEALHSLEWRAMGGGTLAFVIGAGAAWWVYRVKGGEPARKAAEAVPGLYRLVLEKWRIDELYEATVIGFVDSLADTAAWVDKWIVDGIIAKLTAALIALAGSVLRLFQNGKVQSYATIMVAGLASVGVFLVLPHGKVVVIVDPKSGNYVLKAPPGLGYHYRWDIDGDDKWDDGGGWTLRAAADVRAHNAPGPGESRTVRVEIRNAFGLTTIEKVTLTRPKVDRSAPERAMNDKGVSP